MGAGAALCAPRAPPLGALRAARSQGAGKSHCINWMAQRGIFPLSSIVCIDADAFRTALPEWRGYVDRDPHAAGALTRTEAGCARAARGVGKN